MKDKINSIDMNGKLDHEEIFSLFKTRSLKTNKEISEKINNFKYNLDFFEYYSNKDIKKLLNILKLKLPENNGEPISSFKSKIELYISYISQIVLSIKLFYKTYDILINTVINAKNYLSKIKFEENIENYNHDNLFLYLESLKISEKNLKTCSNNSTFNCFSPDIVEPTIHNNPSTPKFVLESNGEFKNRKINANIENSIENNSLKQKDSVLTLSKYVFAEESFIPENHESKLNHQKINSKKN